MAYSTSKLKGYSMNVRRWAAVFAAAAGVSAVMAGPANAADTPGGAMPSMIGAEPAGAASRQDLAKLAATLEEHLGDRSAGSYVDTATGKLTVTVTNSSAAQTVRAAGATARTVVRSRADLRRATEELDRSARIPGTAWGVDPAGNQVVISVDDSVKGADLAKLKSVAAKLGAAVRVEPVSGQLRPLAGPDMKDGTAIYTGQGRCSLGFNVLDANGGHHFLTAGHCTHAGLTWFGDQALINFLGSNNSGSSWVFGAGGDFGLVDYQGVGIRALDGIAGTNLRVTGWGDPVVGQSVQRSGSTSGVHSGKVTALDATVNYPEATVKGLTRTTVCAEQGDSGGPFYKLSTPQGAAEGFGLTSGGSGNCSGGGITFFQPVGPIMQGYALQMWVTGP
ncbi:S1 family peptidase [Amycolatopsis sp. NPDC051716]|uniref:S1 family peptidase n=1 Tax=Amycolatopsis sp. NPDC051716 TaxID=3155804 RepID=UPI003411F811